MWQVTRLPETTVDLAWSTSFHYIHNTTRKGGVAGTIIYLLLCPDNFVHFFFNNVKFLTDCIIRCNLRFSSLHNIRSHAIL